MTKEPRSVETNKKERWSAVLAWALAAWYVLGATVSVVAAVLWRERVSRARFPPAGMLADGVVSVVVAGLALASSFQTGRKKRFLWWGALALAFSQLLVGAIQGGISADDLVDAAIVALALIVGLLLYRVPASPGPREVGSPRVPDREKLKTRVD
jgi:hypothetical protein